MITFIWRCPSSLLPDDGPRYLIWAIKGDDKETLIEFTSSGMTEMQSVLVDESASCF